MAVVVREWVAQTAEAYRGIVGFLASLRDQVSTVIWNTDSEDPLPHLLKEQQQDPALAGSSFDFGLTHRFGEIGAGSCGVWSIWMRPFTCAVCNRGILRPNVSSNRSGFGRSLHYHQR